jgi:hypothetical protein
MKRLLVTVAAMLAVGLGPAWAQGPDESPSQRALRALADFGIAYSYWTMEGRCRTLTDDQRAEFGTLIGENVAGLSAVFPPETVSSVAGAGAQMANDPLYEGCFPGDVRFGQRLARGVKETLETLPKGFKADVRP